MFAKDKNVLIAAQNVTVIAQAQTIKAQAEVIVAQLEQKAKDELAMAELRRTVDLREQRVAQLEAYIQDLGINLTVIEGALLWWPLAKKAIALNVVPAQVSGDLSFASEEQRAYVVQLANAVVGSTHEHGK